jgi:hypothetical protein
MSSRSREYIEVSASDIGVALTQVVSEQPAGWLPLWKLLEFFPCYATWEVVDSLELVWKFGRLIRFCGKCRHVIQDAKFKHDPECVFVTKVSRKPRKPRKIA